VTDPIVFPDVERLVVDSIKDRAELAGIVVDNKPPPGFNGTQKVVLVSRAGGAWIDDQYLDQPLIDLECYGPDKTTAHGVSLRARAAVLALRGAGYGGAQVVDVAEMDGPRWLPDYHHAAASRYLATVRLLVRPA
jgi:hypothetical protein